ncbi:MAG: asparagine synthase-related protein, partial [Ramlibacter sp.]
VPLIGDDLAYRRTQLFTVPVGDWYRSSSHDGLRTTLRSSEMIGAWFEPRAIATMLERHRSGQANFTRELRALAALALWDAGRGEAA